MNISGIVKSSFIDYPGCASTVIFLGGCNFRCGYCHNPEIVHSGEGEITLPDFFAFLEKRKKFVDAVCISGGEPTIHSELFDLIRRTKELGYKVKLDTNGTNPVLLRRLAEADLLNHVAMDIKGPWEAYPRIAGYEKRTGTDRIAENVKESFQVLKEAAGRGALIYELRTTVCRELLGRSDIERMAVQLSGADQWYLQAFKRQGELLDDGGSYSAYTPEEMEELRGLAEAVGGIGAVRTR